MRNKLQQAPTKACVDKDLPLKQVPVTLLPGLYLHCWLTTKVSSLVISHQPAYEWIVIDKHMSCGLVDSREVEAITRYRWGVLFTRLTTARMGDLSSGTGKVVENVVVVEKQAHGLPDNAKEEPKYHISNLHPFKSTLLLLQMILINQLHLKIYTPSQQIPM